MDTPDVELSDAYDCLSEKIASLDIQRDELCKEQDVIYYQIVKRRQLIESKAKQARACLLSGKFPKVTFENGVKS